MYLKWIMNKNPKSEQKLFLLHDMLKIYPRDLEYFYSYNPK